MNDSFYLLNGIVILIDKQKGEDIILIERAPAILLVDERGLGNEQAIAEINSKHINLTKSI